MEYTTETSNALMSWVWYTSPKGSFSQVTARRQEPRFLIPGREVSALVVALRGTLGTHAPSLVSDGALIGGAYYLALHDLACAPATHGGFRKRLEAAAGQELNRVFDARDPRAEWLAVARVTGRGLLTHAGPVHVDGTTGCAQVLRHVHGYSPDGIAAMASVAVRKLASEGALGAWLLDLITRAVPFPCMTVRGLRPETLHMARARQAAHGKAPRSFERGA